MDYGSPARVGMSPYRRTELNCYYFDIAPITNCVTEQLHSMSRTCSIIRSTLLSNNVLSVDVHDHEPSCHGEDTKVFVLLEATKAETETHFVAFAAIKLHISNKSISGNALSVLRHLKYSMLSRQEYKSTQDAYQPKLFSHNVGLIGSTEPERIVHYANAQMHACKRKGCHPTCVKNDSIGKYM